MSTVKDELEFLIRENNNLMSQKKSLERQLHLAEELNREMYSYLCDSQQKLKEYEHLNKVIFGGHSDE